MESFQEAQVWQALERKGYKTMRVIMFQPQFAPKVASGQKTQTIRKNARCKPGDILSLRKWKDKPYRSKQERLCEDVPCGVVCSVIIDRRGVFIDGEHLERDLLDGFAKCDGFKSFDDMCNWFEKTHGLPFGGELIMW